MFEIKDSCVTECGRRSPVKVNIDLDLWILLINFRVSIKTEWGVWLKGEIRDGLITVNDYCFPKSQEVSAGAFEFPVNAVPPEGVIGTCHSHVEMSPFWSGTDLEFLLEQYPLNLVIGKDDEYKLAVRHKVPCGSFFIEEDVRFSFLGNITTEQVDIARAKLEKSLKKKTYGYRGYLDNRDWYGYGKGVSKRVSKRGYGGRGYGYGYGYGGHDGYIDDSGEWIEFDDDKNEKGKTDEEI